VGSLLFHLPPAVVVMPTVGGEGGVAGACNRICIIIPSV
jgi:hypothetical protein